MDYFFFLSPLKNAINKHLDLVDIYMKYNWYRNSPKKSEEANTDWILAKIHTKNDIIVLQKTASWSLSSHFTQDENLSEVFWPSS